MLSHHPSGLAVIAAPNRPAEMRSFDPDVVTRLLDLVSSQFRLRRVRHAAHLVLLDRQRAARLQQAVHRQRDDGAGPAPRQAAGRGDPRAARRRAEAAGHRQPLRAADVLVRACSKADIEQALGDDFAGCIPNNYGLVREAIDRGVPLDEVKPGNKITAQLKKLMLPQPAAKAAGARRGLRRSSSSSLGALTTGASARPRIEE